MCSFQPWLTSPVSSDIGCITDNRRMRLISEPLTFDMITLLWHEIELFKLNLTPNLAVTSTRDSYLLFTHDGRWLSLLTAHPRSSFTSEEEAYSLSISSQITNSVPAPGCSEPSWQHPLMLSHLFSYLIKANSAPRDSPVDFTRTDFFLCLFRDSLTPITYIYERWPFPCPSLTETSSLSRQITQTRLGRSYAMAAPESSAIESPLPFFGRFCKALDRPIPRKVCLASSMTCHLESQLWTKPQKRSTQQEHLR